MSSNINILDAAYLFVDSAKVNSEVTTHLQDAGVIILPYENALSKVEALAMEGKKIWIDPKKVNQAMYR